MSNSRSSVPVVNLFGLVYLKARATRSCHRIESLKLLNPKELTTRGAVREVKTRIGQELHTCYTGKATSGLKTGLTPPISGAAGEQTALVTVVCTCILGTQLSGPDPDALANKETKSLGSLFCFESLECPSP